MRRLWRCSTGLSPRTGGEHRGMSGQLAEDIRQFLRGVEATQDDLAALYRRKRAALTQARPGELLQIADSETGLAKQLQAHLARRRQILRDASQAGLPGG